MCHIITYLYCSGAVPLSDVMKIVEECLNNNDEESLRNAFKVSDLC